MHTNHLIHEKSPYLIQHAHNPVDWYPWGEAAFALARQEQKPIFLSIGYSSCHWCHVMAHESFENPEIAEILNAHFICIKVDREERPDVDRVYMTYVQATTGSGGWPMSVWLTPDLTPFHGGTYYPPDQLAALAHRIATAWQTDPSRIITSSKQVVAELRALEAQNVPANHEVTSHIQDEAFQQIAASFDAQAGGFGAAPKFPSPVIFNFLTAFYAGQPGTENGKQALEMTLCSLRQLAAGGIHDQLGGGFHRYAVDRFWRVPHFEKMLYDQAQLALAYSLAFQITGETQYEVMTRDILDYVRETMTDPAGGCYSAEDADSLMAAGKLEHAEGAFYVWTADAIAHALGPERTTLFDYRFGVEPRGNVPDGHDTHAAFAGKNILFQKHTLAETAAKFGLPPAQASESLGKSRSLLLAARNKRPRPHCDDKIITAWNGLMLSAFARASQVLDDPGYREAATHCAAFLHQHLYRARDRTLLRSYRNGASAVEGFADDYANVIRGLLDLYETTFDPRWVEWAIQLQTRQDELFWDESTGGYFTTTGKDAHILWRTKEIYDGAEPSANAVAALNLLRLSQMLDRPAWRERAAMITRAFQTQLEQVPTGMPQMLTACQWLHAKPKQIVIAGQPDAPDTRALLREVHRHFIPNKILLLADGGAGQKFLGTQSDRLLDMVPLQGVATAYVCENYVCQLPTSDIATLARLLTARE